ncbi:MAG: 4Fe-4S double cluster binding domain-containing protein [Promethearchaeota archaeon]
MDSKTLHTQIIRWGASLVGFAGLEGVPLRQKTSLIHGVAIAVRLSDTIIDEIRSGPTAAYAAHYRATNQRLDAIATKTTTWLLAKGYRAVPIPASQTVDQTRQEGRISHKKIATRAGLGWIGKNALLVTPQHGPRMRLVSVLTNAPLEPAEPITASKCGDCSICVDACPVGALTGKTWTPETSRADLLDVASCHQLTEKNKSTFGAPVCGICFSVCPFGRTTESSPRPG